MNTSTFTASELAELTRPCVYIFTKGKTTLYVGKSKNGFLRFGDRHHHARQKTRYVRNGQWEPCDAFEGATVRVFWFEREAQIAYAEARAISTLTPRHNTGPAQLEGKEGPTGHPDLDAFLDVNAGTLCNAPFDEAAHIVAMRGMLVAAGL